MTYDANALMSMERVFKTRLQRRGVKQSGKIGIEFKTVNEYSVRVNKPQTDAPLVVLDGDDDVALGMVMMSGCGGRGDERVIILDTATYANVLVIYTTISHPMGRSAVELSETARMRCCNCVTETGSWKTCSGDMSVLSRAKRSRHNVRKFMGLKVGRGGGERGEADGGGVRMASIHTSMRTNRREYNSTGDVSEMTVEESTNVLSGGELVKKRTCRE
ncbi:hypothetical protein Tco_0563391 [Tanacetum coccineum]